MNQWVKQSIKLANGSGYLDKLSQIYPVGLSGDEIRLSEEEIQKISNLFSAQDKRKLLDALIELERFPYDEPYVGFFRADSGAIRRNPKTTKRIISTLKRMGLKKIITGANKAKSESRKFGQSFRKWIRQEWGSSVYTDGEAFLKSKGIAFLDGGDKKLKEFAKQHFNYRRNKGLDFVALAYGVPIIGEAKFISASGGTQDKSFREGIEFLKKRSGATRYVAVLDGVVWSRNAKLYTNGRKNLYGSLEKLEEKHIAISALLLNDFLRSLK